MRLFCSIICLLLTLSAPAAATDRSLAVQVLEEINLARIAPHTYAGFLREFRNRFKGEYYLLSGSDTRIQAYEGVRAVDEAIRYLVRQPPLPPLTWSDGLVAAAAELAEEQGRSDATGHAGLGSYGMRQRIDRHGIWDRQIAENIGYGPTAARDMVMQLIIDDGVPDRGHRTNTFSTVFRTAGVACGPHQIFGSMCVIDFADAFRE
ncbi:CAP domain-containing protein [Geobacter sp. FeAm09]|uniref:CAP domain-containing protein n=1 Tax=Geobacter sp. FeAm09 TaxID=2597769 RepID=UPI0011EFEB28|nr:CAP domain-containing protein [Geobacter sp. FeAm09]QEM69230.1 CAP domain-containing protein [Geobacter sp. FeAm09]